MEFIRAAEEKQKIWQQAQRSLCKLSEELNSDSIYRAKFHILALYLDRNSQTHVLESYLDDQVPKSPLRELILRTATRPTRSIARKVQLPSLRTKATDSSVAETERLLRAISPREKPQTSPRRQVHIRRSSLNPTPDKPQRPISTSYSSNEWHHLSSILRHDDLRLSSKGLGRGVLYQLAEQFQKTMSNALSQHKIEFSLIESLSHKDVDSSAVVNALIHLYEILEWRSGLSTALETDLVMYAYTNRYNTELKRALVDKIEEALTDSELLRIMSSSGISDFWVRTAHTLAKDAAKMFAHDLVNHTKDSKPSLRLVVSKTLQGPLALLDLFVQAALSFLHAKDLSADHQEALDELKTYLVLFAHLLVLTCADDLKLLQSMLSMYKRLLSLLSHKAEKTVRDLLGAIKTPDTQDGTEAEPPSESSPSCG